MIIAIDGFSEADNIKEISRLGIDWIGLDFVADSPRRVRHHADSSIVVSEFPGCGHALGRNSVCGRVMWGSVLPAVGLAGSSVFAPRPASCHE